MLFLQICFLMVGQEVRDTTDMTIIIDMNKTLSNYSFTDMFSKSNEFWDKMQQSVSYNGSLIFGYLNSTNIYNLVQMLWCHECL